MIQYIAADVCPELYDILFSSAGFVKNIKYIAPQQDLSGKLIRYIAPQVKDLSGIIGYIASEVLEICQE
jgi:hypothetical protein